MIYCRISNNVFFLLPSIAVGVDIDGRYFFEVAFMNIAIGLGAK